MSKMLEQYKSLVVELRIARMYADDDREEKVEEDMTLLWDKLTAEEQLETESFAHGAFPERTTK